MVMEIVDQLKAFHAEDLRGELLLKHSRDYQVARVKKSWSDAVSAQVNGVFGGISYSGDTFNQVDTNVHVWIRWKLKSDPLFRRLNDYGLFDLSRSAWDYIPYSFVIDMLAGVSDYLQAVDARLKANVLSSGMSISVSHSVVRTLRSSNAAGFGWTPAAPYGSYDSLKVVVKSREANAPFPAHPTVKVKLDLYNVATVAALLKQGSRQAQNLRV